MLVGEFLSWGREKGKAMSFFPSLRGKKEEGLTPMCLPFFFPPFRGLKASGKEEGERNASSSALLYPPFFEK